MSDKQRLNNKATRAFRRAIVFSPLAYLAASLACSSGHKRAGEIGDGLDLDHGHADAGPRTTEEFDAGGSANGIEPTGDAGVDPASKLCGNGVVDPGEDCDGTLALDDTCHSRGFDNGSLSCGDDCRFDTSACSGVENCFDGRDNDGNGLVDCADGAACATSCADPCQSPPLITVNSTVIGSTRGRSSLLAASCSQATSGPDMAYELHISQDSKLDVRLTSTQALNLSVRTSCGDSSSDLSCSSQTRVTLDAHAGDVYYLVVDGDYTTDAGDYTLDVHTRQVVCGDGIRDDNEQCDDGNTASGDGCDASCGLELSETEPDNNRRFRADDYDHTPWIAEIGSATDIDYYRINVPNAPGSIVARILDLGDNACAYNLMDTVVQISKGGTLLTSDDDSGPGKCSLAVASGLSAGDYFVKVTAADGASPASFPYKLDISVGVCGDGVVTLAEECDDGNLIDGDGCDSSCTIEFGG